MNEKARGQRRNISLSSMIWGELKRSAFHQGSSASGVICDALQRYLDERPGIPTNRQYKSRHAGEGEVIGRTVYIPDSIWGPTRQAAESAGVSVAFLVDVMLKDQLGLGPLAARKEETDEQKEEPAARYVQVGNKRIDLGENPMTLDLSTGEVRPGVKGRGGTE
jgi:hypothetical protein